jgi:hypothetical protein
MPYSKSEATFFIDVSGISHDFLNEFSEFLRKKSIVAVRRTDGDNNGEQSSYFRGGFSKAAAEEVEVWLQGRGVPYVQASRE